MTPTHTHFPVPLPAHVLAMAAACFVRPEHIDEHFIRGHGHGGQKKNKTSSCVQLIHRPTGTEVKFQAHREQRRNRIEAYTLLIEKIDAWRRDVEHVLAEREFQAQH